MDIKPTEKGDFLGTTDWKVSNNSSGRGTSDALSMASCLGNKCLWIENTSQHPYQLGYLILNSPPPAADFLPAPNLTRILPPPRDIPQPPPSRPPTQPPRLQLSRSTAPQTTSPCPHSPSPPPPPPTSPASPKSAHSPSPPPTPPSASSGARPPPAPTTPVSRNYWTLFRAPRVAP
jgi:hypothetical protein